MKRTWIVVVLTGLAIPCRAPAQTGSWNFRWQKGQVLTYRVEHVTTVSEVLAGSKVEMVSRLKLLKKWEVQEVDEKGGATLRLSLAAMRNEQVRPNGEVLFFDSANLDKSTPELRGQLEKFIGKTLALLRVDHLGKVIEVLQGSKAQFESDPPLGLCLAGEPAKMGQTWVRDYQILLEPPYGTGEKYQGQQQFRVTGMEKGRATVRLATEIKNLPANLAEQMPLLQKQPQGEVVFNLEAGRLESVSLQTDKTLTGHQGAGSSYHFVSTYREELVEGK